jgi:peptide-methionine (S)-S-oxide reductase
VRPPIDLWAWRFKPEAKSVKTATFGAGCFWGVEATFRRTPGVIDTAVGYAGGHRTNPTYEDVCTDRTGHAEVVRVEYDPDKVSYEELLEIFWMSHDPTQLNRQGPDFGSQYRSVIFYHDLDQMKEAEASKARFDNLGRYRRPIVTQIVPEEPFYRAEEYHQQYLKKRGLESCSTH